MRSSAVAAAAALLAATGCGGNYSNDDVEFAAAVPRRGDVTVGMPRQAGLLASGLREGGLNGFAVGDASQAYANTRSTADTLDGIAGSFVQLLESATQVDPTLRTPTLRIWGPFNNPDTPGFEFQLVITRQPVELPADPTGPHEGFYWQIQYKLLSAVDWPQPPLVEGFYEPGDIRHGRGFVQVYVAEARAAGLPPGNTPPQLARITLGYDTRADQPHTILMQMTDTAAQMVTVAYQELATLSGLMIFDVRQNDPAVAHALASSRWTPDDQGRMNAQVLEGTAAGLSTSECWDAQQLVVYEADPAHGVFGGSESSCAFVP